MNSRKKGPRGKGHFESTPADPSNVLFKLLNSFSSDNLSSIGN